MKKFSTFLAWMLCLMLALPCAAEEAYVPGETAEQIFANVWDSGRMIRGDMKIRLNMNGAALGMTEEEQKELEAVSGLLDELSFGIAAGKLEDGVRIELDAALEGVSVDAAANIDMYGIALESDLIEGQKVTAKWETLLAMAGLSDSDISMIMMMRDIDWNTVLPELLAAAEQYIQLAAVVAQPYAETITAWSQSLTMEIDENVEAGEGYPAAAMLVDLYLTEANVGDLITRLANQLKEDATLAPMIDMLLAQSGESITTAQLCDALAEQAAEMTDTENPIMFTLAMNEAGEPLYGQFFAYAQDGSGVFAEIVGAENETGAVDYALNLMTLSAQNELVDAFSVSGTASAQDFTALTQVYAAGVPVMGCEYIIDSEPYTTDEGMSGMNVDISMAMNAEDGEEAVQMVMSGNVKAFLTADGGEVTDVTMNMDMYVEDQSVNMTATGGMSVFPTDEGLSGAYGVSESAPAIGLDAYGVDVVFSSSAYDAAASAALTEFALDSATSEDMNALMTTLADAAQEKLTALTEAIPADALNVLLGE